MSLSKGKIEKGDTIRIRWPEGMKKTRNNITYVVEELPKKDKNWWTLVGTQNGELLIITELIEFEVLN